MNLNILEVLDVENVTEKSTFHFIALKIFNSTPVSPPRPLFPEYVVNNNLCLYCHIIKKDTVIPLKVKIPQNEMGQEFLSLYEKKTLTDFKIFFLKIIRNSLCIK